MENLINQVTASEVAVLALVVYLLAGVYTAVRAKFPDQSFSNKVLAVLFIVLVWPYVLIHSVEPRNEIVYVQQTGSDGNDGRSKQSPQRTIGAAVWVANELLVSGRVDHVTVHILDDGTYTDRLVLAGPIRIYGPQAILSGSVLLKSKDAAVQLRVERTGEASWV